MEGLKNSEIKDLLRKGKYGLELESHRITRYGFLSHSPHPFPGNKNIVRDFSEDQIEINTDPAESPEAVRSQLLEILGEVQEKLANMDEPELLWPFSNPPYILNEEDIHIAQWDGEEHEKTVYREYLADRYGRYKMTYSGIHFNYSFNEDILKAVAERSGMEWAEYRDRFYLSLAEKTAACGWLLVVLMSASPVVDRSLIEQGKAGSSEFQGFSSVRCSELGYWNNFNPILDYRSISGYVSSIKGFMEDGLLRAISELYYPVRIKPFGKYSLEGMLEKGVSHIELRMIDLNPMDQAGIAGDDIKFMELFLLWLTSFDSLDLEAYQKAQSVRNFQNAAHYDLNLARITTFEDSSMSVREAAVSLLNSIYAFYEETAPEVLPLIKKQMNKVNSEKYRYAAIVLRMFGDDFVLRGLQVAEKWQEGLRSH